MWGKHRNCLCLSCQVRTKEVKTMNKMQKIVIGLGIAGAVGITYVLTALKGMPEAFDWEDDEEESYE